MKKLISLILACVLVLSLAACSSSDNPGQSSGGGNSASSTGTAAGGDTAASGDEIHAKLAVVGPLTGDYAEYGAQMTNATQMAIDEWNEKGVTVDGKKVIFEMASYDDAGKADEGAALAEQIVTNDSIIAVANAHFQSAVALVACPTYQNAGIIAISNGASHPDYTAIGPYVVRNNITDLGESRNTIQMVYRLGYKKVALTAPETDFGVSSSSMMEEHLQTLKDLGADIELVGLEYYGENTDDYGSVISKLAATGCDVVINLGTYDQICPFAIQKQRSGYEFDIMACGNCFDNNLITLGGEATEGIALPTLFNPKRSDAKGAEFVQNFEAFTGGTMPNHIGSLTYDSASYIMYLVEQTGSLDRETIMKASHEIPYDGVTGTIMFDEENECEKIQVVMEIKDGEFVEIPNLLTTWDDFLSEF